MFYVFFLKKWISISFRLVLDYSLSKLTNISIILEILMIFAVKQMIDFHILWVFRCSFCMLKNAYINL